MSGAYPDEDPVDATAHTGEGLRVGDWRERDLAVDEPTDFGFSERRADQAFGHTRTDLEFDGLQWPSADLCGEGCRHSEHLLVFKLLGGEAPQERPAGAREPWVGAEEINRNRAASGR